MRDILFRGADAICGQWVEGSLLVDERKNCFMGQCIMPKKEAIFTLNLARQNGKTTNRFIGVGLAMVIPETVGQFTGRYDDTRWEDLTEEEKKEFFLSVCSDDGRTIKYDRVEKVKHLWHGRRIFEGDIVDGLILHNMPIRAVVAFQEGAFGLDWQRGKARVFTAFTSYCNTVFKVIGNIHDNPELLKGE